jgi:molecular chaperone DnaJ
MNGEVRREWFDKDFYQVLGVPKNAPADEVKKAYRKLAHKFHPDANQGSKDAEDRFKEVSAAYDVLGDPEKRAQYDRVREMAASGYGGYPGQGDGRVRVEGFPFGAEGLGDLGDLFSVFGGRGGAAGRAGGRQPARGTDLEAEAHISFEEAMAGTTVPIRIQGPAPCPVCGGSGAKPGTHPDVCPECHGTGTVAENQGFFSFSRTCPRCGGSGRIVPHPCERCGGSGSVRATRQFAVRITPGARDGMRIRLAGRGEQGPVGAKAGDLFVVVRVAQHPLFGRRGSDLTMELPITFAEAALGAQLKVPTLDGSVTLKIPAGTKSGQTFRIRGKGAPKPKKNSSGDLLVTVTIDVPAKLSKEEKELIGRLKEVQKESPRKRLGVEA